MLTGSHAADITSVICIRIYDVHQPTGTPTHREVARVHIYIYITMFSYWEVGSNIIVTGLIIPIL